jgi:curli biogenesis system outer membrane secretion channel CsgG
MKILSVAALGLLLAGCAGSQQFAQERTIPQGPAPKAAYQTAEGPLACVAQKLTPRQMGRSVAVLDFIDKSGAENRVGNDSFGTFNTQAASDMLMTSLVQTGVKTIELGPSFRVVTDWLADKSGAGQFRTRQVNTNVSPTGETQSKMQVSFAVSNVLLPEFGLQGAISTTDFMPGSGVSAGAFGVSAGYEQNWAITTMDLRVIAMPQRDKPGGTVLYSATVEKQVVQDGLRLGLTRFMGDKPTLVHFEVGGGRREPMKYAARAMINTLLADLLSQMYNIRGCMPEQGTTTIAGLASK